MAWQDLQRTMKLLSALSEVGKGQALGGTKSAAKGGGPPKKRLCPWAGCAAAEKGQHTTGNATACHCCKRSFSATPPIEKLVQWAYDEKLKKSPTISTKGKGKDTDLDTGKGKGKSSGKGKGKHDSRSEQTDEELAALRKARLEGLKTGTPPPPSPPPALTPTQACAQVFHEDSERKLLAVTVDESLSAAAGKLGEKAAEVLDSLRKEHFPSRRPLLTVEVTLSQLLLTVTTCTSMAAKEAAEKALKATSQAVTTFRASGTADSDPDLAALIKRLERQQKEVDRLVYKAPTVSLQKAALVDARGAYQRQLQEESDFTNRGRQKAASRAEERLADLEQIYQVIFGMREVARLAAADLTEQHEARTADKTSLGIEVLSEIDERIQALDQLMIVDLAAEEAESDPEDAGKLLTTTEEERDALRVQLARLKNSTLAANAELAAADPAVELANAQAEILQLKADLKTAEAAASNNLAQGGAAAATAQQHTGLPATGSAPNGPDSAQWTAADDLLLDFAADAELLPKVQDPIPADIEAALDTLAALFAAVPWGAQLPPLTFGQICVPPNMVHTLVGDKIWEACWGERQGRVNGNNFVPNKLVTILKWITEQATLHLDRKTIDQGLLQYSAVAKEATERRKGGSPY